MLELRAVCYRLHIVLYSAVCCMSGAAAVCRILHAMCGTTCCVCCMLHQLFARRGQARFILRCSDHDHRNSGGPIPP